MKRIYSAMAFLMALTGPFCAVSRAQEVLYGAKADYPTGIQPQIVLTGDFNGDGKPDILTQNILANSVSVLLNKGDGTFAAKKDHQTYSPYASVAVGDFNGDGKLDLVFTGSYDASFGVALGNGDGTFAPNKTYYLQNPAISVAVGDFNGDGKLDLAFGTTYDRYLSSPPAVEILSGNGDGTFPNILRGGVSYTRVLDSPPYALVVGDFNGDGKPDIATANPLADTVSVFLNNGNGAFAAKVDYQTGPYPASLALGDFNGDGKPDIVVTSGGEKSILLNKGDGVFVTNPGNASVPGGDIVAVGDCNGDGKADLIFITQYSNADNFVLLGKGDGTFTASGDYMTGSSPVTVAAADFNGDGKLDLAVANDSASTVSVLLNIAERSRVSGLLVLEGVVPSAAAQPVTFTFRSPGYDDFAPSLYVLPAGNFAINLPKRSGILHIKGSKYLAANVSVDATGGNVSGITALLPAGDANNDNSVDSTDFGLLIGAFNSDSSIPGSGYDPAADFDSDGRVDSNDFGLLIGEFNSVGDQ